MPSKAQLARDLILGWIESGRLSPGQRLAPERELAVEMGMNHRTVRRALAELANEGLIIKRPHVGNFVRDRSDVIPVALLLPAWLQNDNSAQPAVGLTLEGVSQSLNPLRHAVSTLFYRPEHFAEDAGRVLTSRGIRNVLLQAHYRLPVDQLRRLVDQGMRVILLSQHLHLAGLRLPSFTIDTTAILMDLMQGLMERRHHEIVVVRYRRPANPMLNLVYRQVAQEAGLDELHHRSLWLPNAFDLDYEPLEQLFEMSPRPSAVVVPDECVASEVFRRGYRHGVRIPEDLSLASVSDLTPRAHPVPLASPDSVHWRRQIARHAAAHLGQLIANQTPSSAQVAFNVPVQWKASVRAIETLGTQKRSALVAS